MLCIMGKLAQISVASGVTFIHYDLLILQHFFVLASGGGIRVNWKSFRFLYLQIIKNSRAGRKGNRLGRSGAGAA